MKNLPPLHLACSKDEMRPSMQCIFIDKGKGVATNGHILVKCQLDHELDKGVLEKMEGMLIHWRKWQFICSNACSFIILEGDGLLLLTNIGKVRLESWGDLKFPDYSKALTPSGVGKSFGLIGINTDLLNTISKVMGYSSVCLQATHPDKKISITPIDGYNTKDVPYESEALFMPFHISDSYVVQEPFKFLKS